MESTVRFKATIGKGLQNQRELFLPSKLLSKRGQWEVPTAIGKLQSHKVVEGRQTHNVVWILVNQKSIF